MLGRKIVKEVGGQKIEIAIGMTKSACEIAGGKHFEINKGDQTISICVLTKEVDKDGVERIVKDLNVEIVDVEK